MARNADKNADKEDRARDDRTGPQEPRRAPDYQPAPAGDSAAQGRRGTAAAGSPAALPCRKTGENNGPRPPAHVRPPAGRRPDTVGRSPAGRVADASTEPIPVIRVSPDGEPVSPEEADPEFRALDRPLTPAGAAPAQPAPAQPAPAQAAPAHATAGQAPGQLAQERSAAATEGERRTAARQATARQAADEATVQQAAKLLTKISSPGRSHRLVGLAAALILVVGGVTAGVLVTGRGGHHRALASSNPVSTVVLNRAHAAAWIVRQVSPATKVSCDPVTCVVIESHGFPASHVRALATGQGNPLVSDLVVATPAVRRQFGARLTSVYAPTLLATFGSGRQEVDIRVIAPHGPVTYRGDLRADLQNRRMSGIGLSGSNRIQAPVTARNQLAAGEVNSRLMIILALMASLRPLHLVSFGDSGPDPTVAPFRSAELSLTGGAGKQALMAFLRAQRPPYQPAHVTTTMQRGRTVLIMLFAAPSPVGLFH